MKLLFPTSLFKILLFSSVVPIDGAGTAVVAGDEAIAPAAAAAATASAAEGANDDDEASDDGASESASESSTKTNKASEVAGANGADIGASDDVYDDLSDDLSDDDSHGETLEFRALLYRLRDGPLVNMGICSVKYHKRERLFTAYPENSPSTYNLVAKVPVPDDGKGMKRPTFKLTEKGRYKTALRLRDYSQVVNVERLALEDNSFFEAVENGRSRNYIFVFKTLPEFESFADQYVGASLPMETADESGALDANGEPGLAANAADDASADANSDDDSTSDSDSAAAAAAAADAAAADADADENSTTSSFDDYDALLLDGQSQDIDQLYYFSAAKASLDIQSSIDEEDGNEEGESGGDVSNSDSNSEESISY